MSDTVEELPPTRSLGRGRIFGVIALVAVLFVLASLRGLSNVYTDYLWYDDLGRTDVWGGILGTKIVLAVVFIAIFFVLAWGNLVIADRIAPALRPPGPEEELLSRWHDSVGNRSGLIRFIVAGVTALLAGGGAASQWNEWFLFSNQSDFEGLTDPVFDQNVSFYVFRLPFYSFVVNWFFAAFVTIGVITAAWHYVNGGIRIQTVNRRSTPQVKAHISVILAILALLKAADYWLDRFELLTSTQGFRQGAFFTDINASLPAINLLLLISLFSVGLLVANIWQRGWALPSLAVGLWALVAVVAGSIYPAAIQQLRVGPDEERREEPFIARNIEATRLAFGLDNVATGDFTYSGSIDVDNILDERDVFSNARLLDPRIIDDSFTLNQQDRAVYGSFSQRVDVDRYTIDGELTPVVIGVRQLNDDGGGSWEQEHAVNTHGYGVVLAPANEFTSNGQPNFVIRDTPLRNDLDEVVIDQPQIYFSDKRLRYAVIGTSQREADFIDGFSYDGDGGVSIASGLRKLAFAFRFGELEPLISGTLQDESEIIFIRDVTDRARRIAPYLHFDSNPYPVIIDGGVKYVVDAYTTSDRFPYAQLAPTQQLPNGADLRHSFNYVRNSVKAVVDAYDGTIDMYVVDDEDPILKAYQKQFPDVYRSIDEMPDELRNHLRFPEDLFRIQTELWGRYRLDGVSDFYANILSWSVSDNPDSVSGGQRIVTRDPSDPTRIIPQRNQPVDPYYQVTRLPDEDAPSFVLMRSFSPRSDQGILRELTSFFAARVGPDGKPELRQYEMTAGVSVNVKGPFQVDEALNADPTISEESTELGQSGSVFLSGNLNVLLVDEAVVYVRPFYVRREASADNPSAPTEPLIEFVAAVHQDQGQDETRIGFSTTYAGALAQLFDIPVSVAVQLTGEEELVDTGIIDAPDGGVIDGETPEAVRQRLSDAIKKLEEAEAVLPDFAEYDRLQAEARAELEALLSELEALSEQAAESDPPAA